VAIVGTVAAAGSVARPASAQGETEPLRYARVSGSEARVRNLADRNGIEVLHAPQGTLVAVYREVAGWLEVEVPDGFVVWVYGRYLQPTEEAGVFEVTRNAVNVRPAPKSDVSSFPLPQRLHAGDRVELIEQLDADMPLTETWARVWSPPGVRAWMPADQVEALPGGTDGAQAWASAERRRARPAPSAGDAAPARPTEAVATKVGSVEDEVRAEIRDLAERIVVESKKEAPDFAPLRAELEAAALKAPSGSLAVEAQRELERLAAFEELFAVRRQLESEREARVEEAAARRAEVAARSRAKDPLGEVFRFRGVLVRRLREGDAPSYVLRFGQKDVAEILCTSARYDLDLFAGCEIGVFGEGLATSAAAAGALPVLDVSRLEILARR